MLVVVQTYPAHFYQTVLCLRSIRQHLPDSRVLVFVDDVSNLIWDEYIPRVQALYQEWTDDIRLISTTPGIRRLRNWPWMRQQVHKLLLHTVIDQPEWLFIDGDLRLTAAPPLDQVAHSQPVYSGVPLAERDPGPGEMSSQIFYYIRHMLGQEPDIMWYDRARNRIYTASNPPVKVMSSSVGRSLQHHIESRFGQHLIDVHADLAADTRMAPCEWDLIEYYRRQILGEQREWYQGPGFWQTTFSADRELGESWFLERGLEIDPKIWQTLPAQKYL